MKDTALLFMTDLLACFVANHICRKLVPSMPAIPSYQGYVYCGVCPFPFIIIYAVSALSLGCGVRTYHLSFPLLYLVYLHSVSYLSCIRLISASLTSGLHLNVHFPSISCALRFAGVSSVGYYMAL